MAGAGRILKNALAVAASAVCLDIILRNQLLSLSVRLTSSPTAKAQLRPVSPLRLAARKNSAFRGRRFNEG